jgi:hypothetical protein
MPGVMARPIPEIYADVQTCMKKVVRWNELHKEIYMQTAPPVGLAQIEAAVVLIQQDLTKLQTCHFAQLQSLFNDSDCM